MTIAVAILAAFAAVALILSGPAGSHGRIDVRSTSRIRRYLRLLRS